MVVTGVRVCEIYLQARCRHHSEDCRSRKKVFREVMTYENPSRVVLMPQPGPSCLVIVALRHFDVIASWQLLSLGPPVTTDRPSIISGLDPESLHTLHQVWPLSGAY